MGILKLVPTNDPNPWCLCFPPLWFTVGIGTIWKCDSCGRVWERQDVSESRKWVQQ